MGEAARRQRLLEKIYMLKELESQLLGLHLKVSKRGTGKGEFLSVTGHSGAVEVSMNNGTLWAEFWTISDEQSDEAPAKEMETPIAADMLKAIAAWLQIS